jgi:hypothetical protein
LIRVVAAWAASDLSAFGESVRVSSPGDRSGLDSGSAQQNIQNRRRLLKTIHNLRKPTAAADADAAAAAAAVLLLLLLLLLLGHHNPSPYRSRSSQTSRQGSSSSTWVQGIALALEVGDDEPPMLVTA